MAEGAPFKWTQWIAPLLIGTVAAGAVVWFGAHHEVTDPQTGEATTSWALLQQFEWSRRSTWALLGVIACMLVRDIGYIVRLRILSFRSFSWRQATENILLWELSSALTPSVVGGSAVAVVILKRDGLRWGKSLATVFATALMDEAFYLIAVPLVFLLASFSGQSVFPEGLESAAWGSLFWVAYAFIATLTTTILLGLVIRPQGTYRGLQWARTTWLLRRWSDRIDAWSSDLLEASRNIRSASWRYWVGGFAATCSSWTARFATLNMVLLIFYPSLDHAAVMARQLVLWLVLSISPTPGSSGAAELGLPAFLGDLTGLAYIVAVVLIWRTFTYFIYLVAGAFVLPSWLVRTRRKERNFGTP